MNYALTGEISQKREETERGAWGMEKEVRDQRSDVRGQGVDCRFGIVDMRFGIAKVNQIQVCQRYGISVSTLFLPSFFAR